MQKDSSRERTRRWRERQRAARNVATVTPSPSPTVTPSHRHGDGGNAGNGDGKPLFEIFADFEKTAKKKADDRFDEFWSDYPRKVAKVAAERAWAKVALSDVRTEEILYGLRAHLPELLAKELQFRPHASTWLHQERWRDPVEKAARAETASERRRREWADD